MPHPGPRHNVVPSMVRHHNWQQRFPIDQQATDQLPSEPPLPTMRRQTAPAARPGSAEGSSSLAELMPNADASGATRSRNNGVAGQRGERVANRAPIAALAAIPTPARAGARDGSSSGRSSARERRASSADSARDLSTSLASRSPAPARYGRMQRIAMGCRRILLGCSVPDVNVHQAHQHNGVAMLPADMDRELGRSLYYAVDSGQHARADALIRSGASTDHRTPGGWTPLLRAAFGGDMAMLEMLLRAGADPNQVGNSNQTALELCVLRGHIGLLTPLLQAHADPAAHDFGAMRRALDMQSVESLTMFGHDILFQMYNADKALIEELEQQADSPGLRGSRGVGAGTKQGNGTREKARLKTLQGIINDSSTGSDEDDFSCAVCFEYPRSVLLQPCRHLALCSKCATQFKTCPICRVDVTQHVTVFLS